MTGVLAWLWANCAGNLVASAIAGVLVWVWKIRPHIHAQAAHRADMTSWVEGLHERLDAAGIPDVGQSPASGAHGVTETLPAVPR